MCIFPSFSLLCLLIGFIFHFCLCHSFYAVFLLLSFEFCIYFWQFIIFLNFMFSFPPMAIHQNIRAVLFDLGGVVMEYNDRAKYLNRLKIIQSNAKFIEQFEQYECGLLTLHDIEPEFLAMMGIKSKADLKVAAHPTNVWKQKNPFIDNAIRSLRSSGKYSIGLWTNTGFSVPDRSETTLTIDTSDFDFVIESCKIGVRKPNANFYEAALLKMGLSASESVFIDDLEENCKGAEAAGIRSIWDDDFESATKHLGKMLSEKFF